MDNGSKITLRARDFFGKPKETQASYLEECRGVMETGMVVEFEGESFEDYDELVEAINAFDQGRI